MTVVLGPDDLIAAHYTLARADRHGIARVPFPARVAAASAAGFRGIGIQPHAHLRSRAEGLTDAAMAAVLDEYGVAMAEVDGFPWWPAPDGDPAAFAAEQELGRDLVERFASHHVIAPAPATEVAGDPADVVARAAAHLAATCDLLEGTGARVGLECLPWSPIHTVGQAWEVVQRADRPSAGLTIDLWHTTTGGSTLEELAAVPPERIVAVHLTDGVRDLSLAPLAETMVGRRLLGEGELPIAPVVAQLAAMGVRTPMTVEVVSLPHRHLDPVDYVQLVHDRTRAWLDEVVPPATA